MGTNMVILLKMKKKEKHIFFKNNILVGLLMHLMLLAKAFFHFHGVKKEVMFPSWKYFQLLTVKQEVKSTIFRGYIFDQKSSFPTSSNIL